MSTATVYFAPTADGEAVESISGKVRTVLDCLEPEKAFGEGDLIGVKMHLGEKPTGGQVPPEHVRPIVDRLTDLGAKPFLTDSCTLYRGRRQNAVDYLRAAHEHGYTLDAVNAPVIIADGLVGGDQHFVAIDDLRARRVPLQQPRFKKPHALRLCPNGGIGQLQRSARLLEGRGISILIGVGIRAQYGR